jgi:hypothetical protein
MPDIWCFFHVRNCSHTYPPKDKFIAVVCKDSRYMGFLINSEIHPFIQKRPNLLSCQILIKSSDYWFLSHDSYLNCVELYPFDDTDLTDGRELIRDKEKKEIKRVVAKADTIERKYQKLIVGK